MRRGVLVLAAVGSLLLAGCTDDPEPRIGTAPSSSAASPSPSEAETTAAAESPEDAIETWIRLETEMQNGDDPAAYLALTKDCAPCRKLAAKVARYYRQGGFIRLSGQEVTQVDRFAANQSEAVYDVYVSAGATEYKTSAGAELMTFPGGPVHYRVDLRMTPTGWTVSGAVRREQS